MKSRRNPIERQEEEDYGSKSGFLARLSRVSMRTKMGAGLVVWMSVMLFFLSSNAPDFTAYLAGSSPLNESSRDSPDFAPDLSPNNDTSFRGTPEAESSPILAAYLAYNLSDVKGLLYNVTETVNIPYLEGSTTPNATQLEFSIDPFLSSAFSGIDMSQLSEDRYLVERDVSQSAFVVGGPTSSFILDCTGETGVHGMSAPPFESGFQRWMRYPSMESIDRTHMDPMAWVFSFPPPIPSFFLFPELPPLPAATVRLGDTWERTHFYDPALSPLDHSPYFQINASITCQATGIENLTIPAGDFSTIRVDARVEWSVRGDVDLCPECGAVLTPAALHEPVVEDEEVLVCQRCGYLEKTGDIFSKEVEDISSAVLSCIYYLDRETGIPVLAHLVLESLTPTGLRAEMHLQLIRIDNR